MFRDLLTLPDTARHEWLSRLPMLLYNHRRLRMTLEALELYVEGGRVSHSCCMCVVGHGFGGLGGGRNGGGGWNA